MMGDLGGDDDIGGDDGDFVLQGEKGRSLPGQKGDEVTM